MSDPEAFDARAILEPEMLTAALTSAGLLRNARIDRVTTSMIGQGQGLTSTVWRVVPTYGAAESTAPPSFIAKMSSAAGESRQIAVALRFTDRECRAYTLVDRTGTLRRPRCYYHALDRRSGDGVLLLEDLSGLRAEDQIVGINPARARAALTALASFHAEWWQNPDVEQTLGLPRFDDPVIVGVVEKIYAAAWPGFLERYAAGLPAGFLRILERLGDTIAPLARRMAESPVTVLHGDFRADNLFFGEVAGKEAVWAIDWQIACVGAGVFDAAYFLSQSVALEADADVEQALLEAYHAALLAGGVSDYPLQRCRTDYSRAVIYGLVYVVIACGLMDAADARSARLCEALLRRAEPLALAHYPATLP